ncbi:MAG: ExeM/NucH family extracellular endonuclease [Acidobacteriota bacterium]
MARLKLHHCFLGLALTPFLGCGQSTRDGDCTGAYRPIHELQGADETSPLADQEVTVRGIVVGDFQGTHRLDGFFVQDPDSDEDPLTSEGLFIFAPESSDVAVGDVVQVTGRVEEYSRLTQLSARKPIEICRSGDAPDPVPLSLASDRLESFEGMSVIVRDELTVASTHLLASAGQLLVAQGGRPFHTTQRESTDDPQPVPTLLIDDGSRVENPVSPPFLEPAGTRRVGDTVRGLVGILAQEDENYVLLPTAPASFEIVNPRPQSPPEVGGTARVASFNLLNLFSTLGERGAESAKELERQCAKHVAAIRGLNADIVALIELENLGDTAQQLLVDALNDSESRDEKAWAAVPTPASGMGDDPIRVGMIYRPATARTVGLPMADHDPVYKRPPLAQTFDLRGQRLTVVVGHFKSKRCGDAEGENKDAGDGQGCWNALRTHQAERLATWVTELQSTGPDVLVLGDLNAYGTEDPIRALVDSELVDQVATHVPPPQRYSYIYSGVSGYLDHALTTGSLDRKVTGVAFWHINSDEPTVHDYRIEVESEADAYYRPDPFRSSDHDPVLIGLDF